MRSVTSSNIATRRGPYLVDFPTDLLFQPKRALCLARLNGEWFLGHAGLLCKYPPNMLEELEDDDVGGRGQSQRSFFCLGCTICLGCQIDAIRKACLPADPSHHFLHVSSSSTHKIETEKRCKNVMAAFIVCHAAWKRVESFQLVLAALQAFG